MKNKLQKINTVFQENKNKFDVISAEERRENDNMSMKGMWEKKRKKDQKILFLAHSNSIYFKIIIRSPHHVNRMDYCRWAFKICCIPGNGRMIKPESNVYMILKGT